MHGDTTRITGARRKWWSNTCTRKSCEGNVQCKEKTKMRLRVRLGGGRHKADTRPVRSVSNNDHSSRAGRWRNITYVIWTIRLCNDGSLVMRQTRFVFCSLENRLVVFIQPSTGSVWLYCAFRDSVRVSNPTVGFLLPSVCTVFVWTATRSLGGGKKNKINTALAHGSEWDGVFIH